MAAVQFGSESVTVEEGEPAVVCVYLEAVGNASAVGCDVSVTLTTDIGKAGMCFHPCTIISDIKSKSVSF